VPLRAVADVQDPLHPAHRSFDPSSPTRLTVGCCGSSEPPPASCPGEAT